MTRALKSGMTLIELLVFLALVGSLCCGLHLLAAGHILAGLLVGGWPFALVAIALGWFLVTELVHSLRDVRRSSSHFHVCRDLVHDHRGVRIANEPVYAWLHDDSGYRLLIRTKSDRFKLVSYEPALFQAKRAMRILREGGIPEARYDADALLESIPVWGAHAQARRLMYKARLLDPRVRLVDTDRLPVEIRPDPLRDLAEFAWRRFRSDTRTAVTLACLALARPASRDDRST